MARPDNFPKENVLGFKNYSYCGECITDIKEWAKKHGQRMAVVQWRHRNLNPYNGSEDIWYEVEDVPSEWAESMNFRMDCIPTILGYYEV